MKKVKKIGFIILAIIVFAFVLGGVAALIRGDSVKITFRREDGSVIAVERFEKGEDIVFPEVKVDGYVVDGWKRNNKGDVVKSAKAERSTSYFVVLSADSTGGIYDGGAYEPSGTYDISGWETFVEFDDLWLDDAHWSLFY